MESNLLAYPIGTRRIMNLMIHFLIAQISDPMNPCPEWIQNILKMNSLKGTRWISNLDPDPNKGKHPLVYLPAVSIQSQRGHLVAKDRTKNGQY